MRRQGKTASSHRQPGKHRKVPIWLIAVLVVAFTVCGAGLAVQAVQTHKAQVAAAEAKAEREKQLRERKHSVLERTFNRCVGLTNKGDAFNKDELTLTDGTATLTLISPNTPLNNYETYKCVAESSGMPEATKTKIGQTNGFSGMRSDSWDNLEATWSYNGDSGLTLILERE